MTMRSTSRTFAMLAASGLVALLPLTTDVLDATKPSVAPIDPPKRREPEPTRVVLPDPDPEVLSRQVLRARAREAAKRARSTKTLAMRAMKRRQKRNRA